MTIELKYETETCSRCSGSGHYSYNQMTGSRCFKCHGRTTVYTKRGLAARKFADELRDLPVTDIKIGDRIYWGRKGALTVTAISEPVKSGYKQVFDCGLTLVEDAVNITGQSLTQRFSMNTSVRRGWTQDMIEEVAKYQDNLTKAGKPRKRAVA
tara:strand:- start:96 stop:557 length:462 start_codon:yes stop_codon:yes gene_type:complete